MSGPKPALGRVLLGLIVAGFTIWSVAFGGGEPDNEAASEFAKSLESSGVFYVINAVPLVSGLALLLNRYVLMALAALLPVLLGVLFFHATMEQRGIPFAPILAALWATFLSRYSPSLSALLSATSEARPSPSDGL